MEDLKKISCEPYAQNMGPPSLMDEGNIWVEYFTKNLCRRRLVAMVRILFSLGTGIFPLLGEG